MMLLSGAIEAIRRHLKGYYSTTCMWAVGRVKRFVMLRAYIYSCCLAVHMVGLMHDSVYEDNSEVVILFFSGKAGLRGRSVEQWTRYP